MSRKISEIYTEYKIMPGLQEHMFRVAAVASLICENFTEPLPKEEIISACLLHDMGNIIKSNLDRFPELLGSEGREYWQKVKDDFIDRYGNDDHDGNEKIAKEIGVSERILELLNAISFLGATSTATGDDMGKKIVDYCDKRVDPFGIVHLEERFKDLEKRYAHHGSDTPERREFENAQRHIEKQIFSKCKIKPEDINNETAAPVIAELRNFVIK